ncbi:MAG: hypothetical protein K0S85_1318 [Pseudomonas orientalis]|nr:hypothetical protein [Pseudomonas orientalis]
MSGAEDLARLTQTIDTANELFLSEEIKMVDVGGGVQRPTNAKIIADLATQMSGAQIYNSVALGLAGTAEGSFFSVSTDAADQYVLLYRNDNGTATYIDDYPNGAALRGVSSLVSSENVGVQENQILTVVDDESGGAHLVLTNKRLSAEAFEVSSDPAATVLMDEDGGVAFYADANRIIVGSDFEGERTDLPGYFITDGEGGLLPVPGSADSSKTSAGAFDGGLLFSPLIVTSEVRDQKLYIQNLLPRREQLPDVVASLASTTTQASETGEILRVNGDEYGAGAVLNLRQQSAPSNRRFMNLTVKNVPVQSVVKTPKILIIGDSICNRQGGFLLKQYLQELGITAQFIGTMRGSAVPNNSLDASGELGEAREGWESGDYTNAVTDRALIIEPGAEDAYKAMPKNDQRERNPFARLATGSDPASIVRNGYVFDPAFYQARFGLETPDIVINGLGTNDVRDRTASTIYDLALGNETIIASQIRAAWPSAKIVRFLPGTAVNVERNALWTSHYLRLIRAIQKSMAERGDANSLLAPTWAMTNPEAGYAFSAAGPVGEDGFYAVDWSDSVHPWQASRLALFQALTPYVAAAAINLI